MNKIFFALTLLLASNVFAATGTGHAQAELSNPLTVGGNGDADFGTIAIDPGAGPQTVTMHPANGILTCPATYVCSGAHSVGYILATGMPNTDANYDITGENAILSDGSGNTLVFNPLMSPGVDAVTETLNVLGIWNVAVAGSIDFTGNEPAGIYNTTNAGGSGYQITVNY